MKHITLLDAYAGIASKNALPAMHLGALSLERREISDVRLGWDALKQFELSDGWLQFQSKVVVIEQGNLPEPKSDWGLLLAAEAIARDGRSLQLRQDGSGGLLLVIATATDAADSDSDSELFLTDDVQRLATRKAPGSLRHRRYWRLDPQPGPVPVFAAFQGFARKKDN